MGHKGHYGEYSGNAKWSRVTSSNMGATKRDDEAHMKYLKEDVDYDNKHGHSDESMTADEKHISKLAGDLKYDEKKHGSPLDYKKIIRKKKPKEPTVHEGGMQAVILPSKNGSPAKNAVKTGENKWSSHAELANMPGKGAYDSHMAGHK